MGHCKGGEVTLWRGASCLLYSKDLCLGWEELKMKLQQEAAALPGPEDKPEGTGDVIPRTGKLVNGR